MAGTRRGLSSVPASQSPKWGWKGPLEIIQPDLGHLEQRSLRKIVERDPLRLKGSAGSLGAGKQEKKAKDKAQIPEQIMGSKEQEEEEEERGLDKRTRAQVALEKVQKQQMERILKKAWKTRKQRVEESQRHLGALTEHCHIPKSAALNEQSSWSRLWSWSWLWFVSMEIWLFSVLLYSGM
ncbi:protein FAM32A-like [Vidua macroura]|uniref:protein FAM32A-like n=1 Tax=Vidua macroura TaxID=187451 RepID=UPI0023A813BD|nr:protein FAM32A-like [Vidua macroura]